MGTPDSTPATSIIITGAAGGIGVETIRAIATDDTSLVCVDVKDDALAELEKMSDQLPGQLICHNSALGSMSECQQVVDLCVGNLSGLIHLAGVFVPDIETEDELQTYHLTMQANLTNGYAMAYAVADKIGQGSGSMVFAASLAFRRGAADYVAYSAAKGGITGMTRALSRKLAPNIRVNALAPGLINTPMPARLVELRGDKLTADVPMKRMGEASEVASVIAFLMGEGASYITGQTINVDGGIIGG